MVDPGEPASSTLRPPRRLFSRHTVQLGNAAQEAPGTRPGGITTRRSRRSTDEAASADQCVQAYLGEDDLAELVDGGDMRGRSLGRVCASKWAK